MLHHPYTSVIEGCQLLLGSRAEKNALQQVQQKQPYCLGHNFWQSYNGGHVGAGKVELMVSPRKRITMKASEVAEHCYAICSETLCTF